MQYDRAFIKPTSLIRAVWICVFVLTSACNKIKNTYNISKSSNQLYTFFNSEINCCNDYTSLEPNNYNKEFVEYIIERLKCCYASYEKIDKDTTDEDIKQYIKCMLYDCNVNVFKDIVTYSIDTINSSGQTNQKRSVILFFYDLLISLLNTFPSRWNSAIEANNQYDSISSPILEKIAFISKMLASCLQQEEKAKNSSFSDQLEVLKSLINKHIFERLKFKEALLSAANYGHVKLIGTLLRMVLELSGPKQYLKMLCTPLDVGTNSDNKWNTMLARALLSCSYAEEVIECLVSNLSHVMNYFPQDIAIKSYFLDQPVQSTPTKYQTALYLAIENNEPALVQCLLKLGANPNIEDSSGQTPLHIAAKHASVEIIQFLLKFGANPSTQDHLGKPALSPKRILERALNPKLVSCSNHILDLPKAILLEHLQRLKSYVDHLLERPFTTYDSQEELLLEAIKNQVCDLSRLECPLNLPTEEILIWLEVYQYARMDPDQRSCDSTATCASSGLGHPLYYRPLSVASVTKPIDTYSLYAF